MELFAALDQTNAAQSIPAQALRLNVDEADPGVGEEGHLRLEIKP
jgi:hypothetical protein